MGLFSRLGSTIKAIMSATTYNLQTPITFSQAGAVQNQYYTVLDTVYNARIYDLSIDCDGSETLELEITINGVVITGSVAVTPATFQFAHLKMNPTGVIVEFCVAADHPHQSTIAEGRTMKIRLRQTSAAGGATILCGVLYGIK